MKTNLVGILSSLALVTIMVGALTIDPSPAGPTTACITESIPAGQIVFSSKQDGQEDIYVMKGDGSSKRHVTYLSTAHQPALSPDGSRIVFSSYSSYLASDGKIYLIHVDGNMLSSAYSIFLSVVSRQAGSRFRRLAGRRSPG